MEMNKDIIGIVGRKRSGKDTIADYLVNNHGYVRYAFADPIKRGAMEMFGFTAKQMWGSDEDKETIDERWGLSPRKMLQIMGTELFQYDIHKYLNADEFNVGRTVWVYKFKLWYLEQKALNPNLKVVISDMRFLHEADIVKELGGTVCRVIRPSLSNSDTHASEVEQERIKSDIEIINETTLDDLYLKVKYAFYLDEFKVNTSVIQILRDSKFVENGEIIFDNFPNINNLPLTRETLEGPDDEPLDFENWSIICLSDEVLVMCAGGDWQVPKTFVVMIVNGELKSITSADGYSTGIEREEIIKIISK